jgi:DNA-binding PadR family transcriptional regulator
MFRYQLLGILRGCDGHGYALAKEYEHRTGRRISAGNVYRELQRLVAEGLVRQRPKARGEDPRRASYEVTENGLAAFDQWFAQIPRATTPGDSELASRALFFAEVEPANVRRVLDLWRSDLWQLTKDLERELTDPFAQRGVDAYHSLIRCRLRQIAAEIELLDDLERVFSVRRIAAVETPAAPQPRLVEVLARARVAQPSS